MTDPNPLILVTGGTGHLGRDLVGRLVAEGRNVRLLSTRPGTAADVQWAKGDLATGDGIHEAMKGVQSVINAATLSPIARRGGIRFADFFGTPSSVDVDGTRRLLEAASRAEVRHFLHVSIVGLEGSSLPYAKVKLAGERLVRSSSVPWSVVHATPFFYLVEKMLAGLGRLPIWPLPIARWNPVDTTDVADYLIACLDDEQRGVREAISGPEDLSLVETARQLQQARGLRRPILPLPLPTKMVRNMGFVSAQGRCGKKTWSTWLSGSAKAAQG
jgi:uncharacterized protein YbjT (DUF2867 family)